MTRAGAILLSLALLAALPACAGGSPVGTTMPARWACPSPMPKPFGPSGPVKGYGDDCTTDPVTGARVCDPVPTYYAQWEQEYGHLGGPPFPAPTPYAFYLSRVGQSVPFGFRVEIDPQIWVQVTVRADRTLTDTATPTATLYLIDLTWTNRSGTAQPFDSTSQVRLRSITRPDGAVMSYDRWGVSARALEALGTPTLPMTIPVAPDGTTVTVPILAPPGRPKTVELSFTPPATMPTPGANPDLRDMRPQTRSVQFTDTPFQYYGAPPCDSPGALTDWASDDPLPALFVDAPAGDGRLMALAAHYAQVNAPYIWGATGPKAFDCSGFVVALYGHLGIHVPRTAQQQWDQLRRIPLAEVRDGDPLYFHTDGRAVATHVGLAEIVDGKLCMIHAAAPQFGVRRDCISGSRYWEQALLGAASLR
jgi:cell wall-associated NlpC family hydrolase